MNVPICSVEEHYNTDGELEKIDMSYMPVARGAGFNHTLKLDLNGVINQIRMTA